MQKQVSKLFSGYQKVFSEFDIVLGCAKQFQEIFRQFSEVLNSFPKSQTVVERLKQFSEVSNSSRKSQTVLGSLKQLSEVLNSSWKSGKSSRSLKRIWELWNSSGKSQKFLGSLKKICEVSKILQASNSSRKWILEFQIVRENLKQFSVVFPWVVGCLRKFWGFLKSWSYQRAFAQLLRGLFKK